LIQIKNTLVDGVGSSLPSSYKLYMRNSDIIKSTVIITLRKMVKKG